MACFLEVHVPGGAGVRRELGERIVIGSSRSAQLSVPAQKGLAATHFAVVPGEDGVLIEVLDEEAEPILVNGKPEREASVPWGVDFFVARVRCTAVKESEPLQLHPALMLLVGVVVLLGAVSVLRAWDKNEVAERQVAASPLPVTASYCADNESSAALYRASQSYDLARAQHQRIGFDWRQAVRSLELMRLSAACYRQAQKPKLAKRSEMLAAHFQRQLEHDYAKLRARLQLSLHRGRYRAALETVAELEALLGDLPEDDYKRWLVELAQWLYWHLPQS